MEETIRILVISGQDEDRRQIITILSDEKSFLITGIEKDETGAVIKSERLKPDVVILDLPASGMNGWELAPILHRRSPATSIILITDKVDNDNVRMAIKAGISGYVLKNEDLSNLICAVKVVRSNGYYVSASILKSVIDGKNPEKQIVEKFPEKQIENHNRNFDIQWFYEKNKELVFTPIERGIVTNIIQGFSDDEIACHFNYSRGTIKNYISAIKRKTKMKNRVQIAIYSLINELITLD